jgi:DNA-binding LacI/PurR family transcriptional regulator
MKRKIDTRKRMGGGRSAASICDRLKSDIAANKLRAGQYLPPVRELCRIHGVAMNTIQRALKRMSVDGLVASELRQGYRVLAKAHDPEQGCPVGLVFRAPSQEWDPLERGLVADFQRAAAARGRSVVAVGVGETEPERIMEQLSAARAWGAVLTTTEPAVLDLVRKAGLPAVVAENWSPDCGLDTVSQDDFRGSLDAAVYLAERGHEAVAWFGSALALRNMHAAGRYAGAVAGLAFFNRRLRPGLVVEAPPSAMDELIEMACRLLSRPDRPTAVLALWQDKVEALARASRRLGLVPGKDFEMVGWCTEEGREAFLDRHFGSGPRPPVVTWSQRQMAEMALNQLEQRRAKPELPPADLSVPARLRFDKPANRK